jgi:UDP-N-acetyl-D-glucosamine dehydrogenase
VQTPEERSFKRLEYNAQSLQDADCVVITTNHSDFDADFITKNSKLVVDLRNVISEASDKVYKL